MRTHLEFTSNAFPPYPGEEEEINPGVWGKRLAEFIVSRLPAHRVDAGAIISEDWGWVIPIKNESFPMFIGCGNQTEPGGESFLCFIDPSKPEIRKGLFKKVNTVAEIERIATALETILRSHPEIKNMRWWTEDEIP